MASDLFGLEGKVAVVTGSTRGIGLAAARLMAEAGARIVLSSRKPEACEQTLADFKAAGHQAIAVPAHVAREEDRQRLISETMKAFGRIDIMVPNAAVNPVFSTLQDMSEDVWRKIMDTNLTAGWRLGQLALPIIAEQGGGAMVLVSSIASVVGSTSEGAYGISKAAVNHLTRQLAVEWGGRDVRVNCVMPGMTRTDMIRAAMAQPGAYEKNVSRIPLARAGEPEDVGAVILFLASRAARQMTGQVLVVDGGQTIANLH